MWWGKRFFYICCIRRLVVVLYFGVCLRFDFVRSWIIYGWLGFGGIGYRFFFDLILKFWWYVDSWWSVDFFWWFVEWGIDEFLLFLLCCRNVWWDCWWWGGWLLLGWQIYKWIVVVCLLLVPVWSIVCFGLWLFFGGFNGSLVIFVLCCRIRWSERGWGWKLCFCVEWIYLCWFFICVMLLVVMVRCFLVVR
jgi:hypothetical protein